MHNTVNNIFFNGMSVEYHHLHADRPVIIFLHDSLGCTELWRDFPLKLAEAANYNALLYDRIGYGRSVAMPVQTRPVNYLEIEADILNDLLIELKMNDAILFGHSDGGSIALIAASKYPDRIKAIICEAAHIFVEEITLKGIYNALEAFNTTDLARRLQKYHGDKVDALFKAWAETWTTSEYRNWNIEHFLQGISCPLLFIQGGEDEYGTLRQVEETINQVNGKAEKCIIPGVGHTPHKEAAELTLKAAEGFIQRLSL
jgi:pimeloyl-ACP methyl ester carboxylesterase